MDHEYCQVGEWGKSSQKISGGYAPVTQISHPGTANSTKGKMPKIEKMALPPMVHKNEQLLFFYQKNSRPNQTAGRHFVFLQKMDFPTSASHSLTAEELPDH